MWLHASVNLCFYSIIVALLRSKHPRLGIHLATQEAFRKGCTILSPYSPLDGHVHCFQFFQFGWACTLFPKNIPFLFTQPQSPRMKLRQPVHLCWGSLMRLVLVFQLFSDVSWVSLPRGTEAFGGLQGRGVKVSSTTPSQCLIFFLECVHISLGFPHRLAQAGHTTCS